MTQYTDIRRENGYSEVEANGIPFNFDDRMGMWSVWNMSLFLDGTPEPTDPDKGFVEFQKLLANDKSIVHIKQAMKINREAYKLNYPSDVTMKLITRLCKPGRASLAAIASVIDCKSGIVLLERYHRFGFIDNRTRRLVKHPQWLLEKYSDPNRPEIPSELSRTEILALPSDCFKYRTVIRYSDLDINFHTNQSVYIKFCVDCAALASNDGKLVHFTGDIARYPVLDISIDYVGECFAGDEVLILLSQDKNDISKLSFWILKDKILLTVIVCHLGLEPMIGLQLPSKY